MRRLNFLVILFAAVGMIFVGCQNEPAPVGPVSAPNLALETPAKITLPAGAVLVSADLYVYAFHTAGQTVNVHRITGPWVEMEVTWNNFGGSFAPEIEGSFTTGAPGWYSVEVTTLVQSWLDGEYENHGFFLEQGETDYNRYFSSEYATIELRPKLVLCFSVDGETNCYTIQRGFLGEVADASITEQIPDLNTGDWNSIYTGVIGSYVKQALIRFELPIILTQASLGDYVWHDENMDGLQQAEEMGIAGVTVNLYDCLDNLLATTTTNEDGYYLFGNLDAGDYYVEFIAPEGYVYTMRDVGGDDNVDSDADPATGITICTTLDEGEVDLSWDAGLYFPVTQEGCTRTIGYWKTHAGFGPQEDKVTPLLPVWLGDAGGTKSIEVTDAQTAVDILSMNVYGDQSNGITKLYAQLLAAKLNIVYGASDYDVADYITEADAFLADYDWTDWGSLSKMEMKAVLYWKTSFDNYNNGYIGPGHCDSFDDGIDY